MSGRAKRGHDRLCSSAILLSFPLLCSLPTSLHRLERKLWRLPVLLLPNSQCCLLHSDTLPCPLIRFLRHPALIDSCTDLPLHFHWNERSCRLCICCFQTRNVVCFSELCLLPLPSFPLLLFWDIRLSSFPVPVS